MSIALISNATIAHVAMKTSNVTKDDVYYPLGRSSWLSGLCNEKSKLYRCEPDIVFIILHGRTLLGEDSLSSLETAQAMISSVVDIIGGAAGRHDRTKFVVSTIDIPLIRAHPLVSHRPEPQAEAFWRRSLEQLRLPILELSEICATLGRKKFYNNRVWYMGYMPFSKEGEDALATEISLIWRAYRTPRRRCIALSLDNILWGGSLAVDGIDGIHLDATGSGSRFYDFQRRLLDLKENGVMLAVISKNSMKTALKCVENHPAMLLRKEDFAAIRVNSKPKPANLESIAEELGIGPDSFVFIDNDMIERETMEMARPEVAVPIPPEDSSQMEMFMMEISRRYFLRTKIGEP
ncbi:MAG: HAD-IIIC family phosphatase [Synergistaceae bacterium]|jgi:HAD superfamily phosphatase (TIGR01681 family)|nr:HAD-IIIC family phosphatase [Synergistaceae bacterium]